MGCSSSAQTQVKDGSRPASKSPDANGLPKCDDNLPITKENDPILDQTKLVAIKEVELGSDGTKPNEGFAEEEADVLIPGITSCALSTCQRVDPEGTEPQPVPLEEKLDNSRPLSTSLLEAGEPLPVEPSKEVVLEPQEAKEAANDLVPQTVHDSKPESADSLQQGTPEPAEEESASLVTEIVKELQVGEEEQQTEGNKCLLISTEGQVLTSTSDSTEINECLIPAPEGRIFCPTDLNVAFAKEETEGETREKMETEMHHEIVSEGSETKEEETGEATAASATEEIEATNNEE